MKRHFKFLILLTIPIITLIFFYISAIRGILIFKDSMQDDVRRYLNNTVYNVSQEIKDLKLKLLKLAEDDVVVVSLQQYEMGESLEKGNLAFKRVAGGLQFLDGLKLINMENKIVIDTVKPFLEGKTISQIEETYLKRINKEKGGLIILPNQQILIFSPCKTKAGNYIGSIIAYFKKDLFLQKYNSLGYRKLNYSFKFFNNVLFFNLPRHYGNNKKFKKIAAYLTKTMNTFFEDSIMIVPSKKTKKYNFITAYAGDRTQVGLPRIAKIIILLNAVVIFGLIILYMLKLKSEKHKANLEDYKNKIDVMSSEIDETNASADQIIKQTENLYKNQESASRKLSAISQMEPEVIDESVPMVEEILSKEEKQDDSTFIKKDHDEELQNLIDKVSHEKANYDNMKDSDETEIGIFKAKDVKSYWENMKPLLKKSLKITAYMLLNNNENDDYIIEDFEGFKKEEVENFIISKHEGLYSTILEKKKALFLKDNVLQNITISKKFSNLSIDDLSQMVIIPIVKDSKVISILIMFRKEGESQLDIYSLREIMYLSIL